MSHLPFPVGRNVIAKVLLILVALGLLTLWLFNTPAGLLGKADAVGYAVCHRIDVRSFHIESRETPLCARCTGMYLGAVLGFVYLSRFGRSSGLPSLRVSVLLMAFLAGFALDGSNSFLHLIPNAPGLYMPSNPLRLLTGTGVGLGIAAMLTPVLHQSLWQSVQPQSALSNWRNFLPLLALAALLDGLILTENPLLLYPLALVSAAGVLIILTAVYTVVWVMIWRQDNHFATWRALWPYILMAFITALAQIAVIDAGRFWLTRTWNGFGF